MAYIKGFNTIIPMSGGSAVYAGGGTDVIVVSDKSGHSTRIYLNGTEITGVRSFNIQAAAGDVSIMEIEFMPSSIQYLDKDDPKCPGAAEAKDDADQLVDAIDEYWKF